MVTISVAQRPIVIKGKIDNCPDRNNAFILKQGFNTERLEGENIRTDFSISEDGSFIVRIPNADEFYVRYYIQLGDEKTHLDLVAGDSIYMTLNATFFDESIKYSGRGAGRNNYRRDVFLQFWDRNATDRINSSNPNKFLNGLNNLTERKLELLNKYYLSKEIDSSYYRFEKTMILNEKASQILKNNYDYHNHKYLPDSVSRQIATILRAVNFSDDHFMQHNEFRELITFLPGYMQENNSITPVVDLKREIDFAAKHYTTLMQLYFNKENIRKYIWQAHSISEKNALLNFFDKQFDAPVLKKEIQEQRHHLRDNRITNSGIFQASIILISLFVLLIAILFVTAKIIQFSSNRRIKINLALWLKVVFYLVVFLAALGFITHSNTPLKGFPFVILLLGVFLTHTYVLIPRYALKKDRHYLILLAAALLAFVLGSISSKQVSGTMYSILVLCDLFFGLILLSWFSYYINQLTLGKSTLKGLIKNGDLDLEIALNLAAVFVINSIFVLPINRDIGMLNQVLLFYSILVLFYFHTFFTFPSTFSKEKVIQFIGINLAILLGASLMMIAMDAVQSYHALKNIGVVTKPTELLSTRNIRPDLLIVFCLLLIPSFVYFYIKRQLASMESTGFQLYRKKEAELAHLRSQVNPHFLFNTLNTLYAFALTEGSDKTAECIAKLANLMRFMLDDMEKESILLTREISYIKDYVKLQSIRSAVEHDISINVEMEEDKSYSIAPMLLIPFVENAFKHGMNPNKVSQLRIDIRAKDNQIQFVIENSVDDHFEAYYKEKGFGIGIENVKSRLKYVYPERHTISIAKTNTNFIVILTIDLI